MKAMGFHPPGFGGRASRPDQVKRDGWREQGVLAVAVDDERLTWPERELVRQLGDKLYGKRAEVAAWLSGPRHGRGPGRGGGRRSVAAAARRAQRLLQYLAGHPAQLRGQGRCEPGPDAPAAAKPLRDQPDGGGDHLEPFP